MFGGSLGSKSGGVTAIAISPNGRLVACSINNGTILVYDTVKFELVRIFTGQSGVAYSMLEFGKDNFSQIIAYAPE